MGVRRAVCIAAAGAALTGAALLFDWEWASLRGIGVPDPGAPSAAAAAAAEVLEAAGAAGAAERADLQMGEEVFLTPKAFGRPPALHAPPAGLSPVSEPVPAPRPTPPPAVPAPRRHEPALNVQKEPPAPRPTPPPAVPAGGRYEPALHARKVECAEQAHNFGHVATVEQCDKLISATVECGTHLMFSLSHPDWACRCCGPFGHDDGPQSDQWDVFRAQVPRLQTLPALPQSPPEVDPYDGLLVAEGPRPDWLVREDQLVVDARGGNEGGILILQAVLMDVNSVWGKKQKLGYRPDWLRAILATNRAHARKHGHAMVLRAAPTQPQLTRWMTEDCGQTVSERQCIARNERENFNWEKHLMISDYLHSPQRFSHVLMLDADAALIQPQLDTLRSIAAQLDAASRDLFLTDEDWLNENGRGRINGGLMMAKNTPFTKQLFLDTFHAHVEGRYLREPWGIGVQGYTCTSNEQICLNDLYYGNQGKRIFTAHVIMASGKQYNRGAERGGERHITDPTTEIMHWMGGSKGSAGQALCNGVRDLTFEGLSGYGCRPP